MNDTRYFERNTRYMVAIGRAMGARVILTTGLSLPQRPDGLYETELPRHNAVTGRIARDEGVFLFDYARKMPRDPSYFCDCKQLSPKGAKEKARLLLDFFLDREVLAPILKSRFPVGLAEN